MKNLAPAIKVSVTFIVTLIIGYWAFMMLAKGKCAGEQIDLQLHAYFQDATGLVEKSRIQIAGLNVGHIVSRELNVQPPRPELVKAKRFAKITIALASHVVLYTNCVVYKRSASLLGEFYLEIDPGTYEWVDKQGKRHVGEKLKSGDELKYISEAVTTDKLIRQVSDVVPVLKNIAEDIRSFTQGPLHTISKSINDGIDENRAAIRSMLANMDAITGDVRNITQGSNKDIELIIEDIKHITAGVRTLVGDSGIGVKDTTNKMKTGLDKLNAAIDKLDSALGHVNSITGDLDEGKGNIGRLLKDEALVDNVEEVVRDTGDFVKSLTQLQTIVGLRSEYNFQANSLKTYLSVELHPRPDKFYLIELIADPRGSRHVSQTITRSDDPSKPMLTREDRVEVTDAFRFSFMFAKIINFATFRFGIKENTGGVGLDLRFANDRLSLESDLFDFAANAWPRYKVHAAFEFFRRLYIVGGIDDVLNERPLDGTGGGRDYFVGGQLRFNDEDLKSLLMVGGSALGSVSK